MPSASKKSTGTTPSTPAKRPRLNLPKRLTSTKLYLLEIFGQEGQEDNCGYPIPDERFLVRLTVGQRDDLEALLVEAADWGNDLVHHWRFTEMAESEFESVRTFIEDDYFDHSDEELDEEEDFGD